MLALAAVVILTKGTIVLTDHGHRRASCRSALPVPVKACRSSEQQEFPPVRAALGRGYSRYWLRRCFPVGPIPKRPRWFSLQRHAQSVNDMSQRAAPCKLDVLRIHPEHVGVGGA